VVVSEGYSIYSAPLDKMQGYFCSEALGYDMRPDVDLIDFVGDIATGTERPQRQRIAETPFVLQVSESTCGQVFRHLLNLSMCLGHDGLRGPAGKI
jgi:hypothetical protein